MPRPVVEQKVVTAPVQVGQSQAPQLGVYAPIEGVRAPQSGGMFQGLAQALGVLGPAVGGAMMQRAEKTQQVDTAAGTTDAELGQVDAERLARSRAYATAVHKVNVQKQYLQAEAATQEWAATNVDKTLPFGDQTKLIDTQMQKQLGGLAKDPTAAAVIAPLYTKFINKQANDIVAAQVQAKQNEALDVAKGTVAQSLQSGGDGDYVGQVATLTPILGDRTEAVKAVTQMYVDHALDVAAKGGDWKHVFDSLPTDITLKDGTKIPGPGRSPALHDAIVRGKDAAQKAYNDFVEPQRDQQMLHVMTHLDSVARSGGLITEESLKPFIAPGANGEKPILTPAQAAAYIDRARNKREELAQARVQRQTFRITPNWQSLIGQLKVGPDGQPLKDKHGNPTGATWSQADVQAAFDQQLGSATGQDFTSPQSVQAAIAMTQQYHGLVSTNLKSMLTQASHTTDPKDALKLLPVYQALKEAKQDGLYLTPQERMYYETLPTQGANEPDAKHRAEVMNAAATYDPERYARLTSADNMKAARDATANSIGGHWYSFLPGVEGATKLDDFANAGQVKIDREQRLKQALILTNGNAAQAGKIVSDQLQQDYVPVTVQGQKLLLPVKDGSDAGTVQANVSAISDELIPQLAKRAGLSEEQAKSDLGWQAYIGPNGVPMVQVVDDMGQTVESIPPNTLDWFLQQGDELRRKNEDKQRRNDAANAKAIERTNNARRAGMASAGRGA